VIVTVFENAADAHVVVVAFERLVLAHACDAELPTGGAVVG